MAAKLRLPNSHSEPAIASRIEPSATATITSTSVMPPARLARDPA